ncbi:hypothetical protein ACS0TY_036488 [Phlomoides rotata]
MESISRPPYRRKHSSTTNASYSSFSVGNPYDDVLLSKGGRAKFEAHDYAEIFAGSSSIPVIELPGSNERVGVSDPRSSKLDYSNIFGGLREDDVAVPHKQLFSGAPKKTKTRIPADVESPFHDPGPVNSSRMTERSSGASDQSNDGVMQQFNMSFCKTDQRNNNESNGKSHIAQLHAVPGFTHFVDETLHLQKKDDERPVRPIKREVSRTWSFSSGAEPITVKGVIASEKSHIPDKSCNVNEINLKSHILKVPPPSIHLSNLSDSKDLKQSSLPSFASKDDSKKTNGEYSPPFLDEELDENSVEAISAAALKKAIDQAQESIRIAKLIMEKRKDGLKNGSKPRSKSRSKVKDKKETRVHHVPDPLKENNVRVTYEKLDPAVPMVNEIYRKFVPSLSHSDNFLNARKTKVEMVRENVEVANEHSDALTDVGKTFASSCSENETLTEEKFQNVEASEAHGKATTFTGILTDAKCRGVTLDSGKVDNSDYSPEKVEPCMEQMETGKVSLEQSELTVHQSRGRGIVSEMEDSTPNSSQSVVEAKEQCQVTVDCIEGPESTAGRSGRLLSCSESEQEQEKVMHEGGGNLRINLTESNGVADDKEECRKEFVQHEGLVCMEKLTGVKFEFDNWQNGLILAEKDVLKQPDLDTEPENISVRKENNQDGKSSDETYQEVEVGIKVNVVPELEIVNKKLNNEQKLPGEDVQSEVADTHRDSSEYEAVENMQMETDNFSDIEKSEISWDVDEVNDTRTGSRRNEENQNKFEFQVVAFGKDVDDVIDGHCSDSDTIFSETQEPCDVDLNYIAEEYQAADRGCKMNDDSLPLETETLSDVEDNEIGKCASEEKFIESQPNSTFKGLSSDNTCVNVDLVDAGHEVTLPKAEEMFKIDSEIHNAAEEYAGKINMINLPEFHTNVDKVTEVDSTVKPVFERTSENQEESLLTSVLENMDEVPTQESQACKENLEDGKDSGVTSDEREYVGEQVERLHSKDRSGDLPSQSYCEPKEMEKSMEVERVGTGQNNEENPSGISSIRQKDAKRNDLKSETNERIEAIKRGREREKDKKAVERAIREARERAFAEAGERAERAAVERAAAEARQRGKAEAQEKHVKASVENKKPADKVSSEAKLRAERAAVERATTEARERALEKAMSQKTYTEAKKQTERSSGSSLNNGLKHSFSSSDLEKFDGAASESAQRCKARLESHQRIMERAAKALAEKNMRDVLAQKEQAERNRLAESLDADIKRWATGKEGNLRALLSTLQYILGPDSGWQPVSLTEIITTAAVKKGYRKATLCVHPDKLQQRGATIQQKYICEKVFDLLKAAWNRFNSEER